MVQDDRHDAILVKIITFDDDGKEHYISGYHTTAIDQTLKMFITAKDYEIDCFFNELSEVVPDEYKNFPGYKIQDVHLCLGSVQDLSIIEVVI